jgi:hypothetical protein
MGSNRKIALAVFAFALILYLPTNSLLRPESDSVPNIYLSASMLGDGDSAFSPFEAPFMFVWTAKRSDGHDAQIQVQRWLDRPPGSEKSFAEHYQHGELNFAGARYYLAPTVRERVKTGEPLFVSTFGPVAGLPLLPFAALAQSLGGVPWRDTGMMWALAKLTAALLAAGSVAFVYGIAVGFVDQRRALLVTGACGAGTCMWTISSQSLWQQTTEIFLLSLGLFCLLRGAKTWVRGAAAGAALSLAAACRPTGAVVAIIAGIALFRADRRAFAGFVLAALPAALSVLAYNAYYFGSPFDFGQLIAGERVAFFKTGSTNVWQTPFWQGAAGLLVSPSRGMLVYSPILAASFFGAFLAWNDPKFSSLRFVPFAVIGLWIPAFLWFDWWGGWAYGYRPIVDSVPLLMLLCLPTFERIFNSSLRTTLFWLALAWSVAVQALGVLAYTPWGWNAKMIDNTGTRANVDLAEYRYRLWSVRDSQIGYLVTHFGEARAQRQNNISY